MNLWLKFLKGDNLNYATEFESYKYVFGETNKLRNTGVLTMYYLKNDKIHLFKRLDK